MIHPHGLAGRTRPSRTGGRADRHPPPVLRRQQPGRHHRRRADRRRAGLHPRRARRAGHELLRRCCTRSIDFDDLRAAILTPPTRTSATAPLLLDLIQMLWDRGEADGYAAAHDRRPAARHAHAQGADARGLRRPPGLDVPGRGRGADDRGARPPAARSPPAARPRRPAVGRSARSRRSRSAARRSSSGTPGAATGAAPLTNSPPRTGDDPHEFPRATPAAREQKSEFLRAGRRGGRHLRRRAVRVGDVIAVR